MVLATVQLTLHARYELTRACTVHDLLSVLLYTIMPHMSGVQDEDSRAECNKMAGDRTVQAPSQPKPHVVNCAHHRASLH